MMCIIQLKIECNDKLRVIAEIFEFFHGWIIGNEIKTLLCGMVILFCKHAVTDSNSSESLDANEENVEY